MLSKREQILFCFCGPSGSGKTSICRAVLDKTQGIENSISTTTRSPRGAEKNEVDYYFVSEEEFLKKIEAGDFIEHASFSSKRYGTEKINIARSANNGNDLLLDIEVQGVSQLKNLYKNQVVTIFVFPPSFTELEKRIRGRGTEDESKIQERLETAKKEISTLSSDGFSDYLLINDDLEKSIDLACEIIMAERNKYSRQKQSYTSKLLG